MRNQYLICYCVGLALYVMAGLGHSQFLGQRSHMSIHVITMHMEGECYKAEASIYVLYR